ncbi:MAG: amidohydrolase family protein [Candidatus Latescibacterota bacterium]
MSVVIDVHAHVFPRLAGHIGVGSVSGLSYGRARMGNEEIQILPPFAEDVQFTPAALIAHMNWAGVDKAVLLQGPFYGVCNEYVLEAVRSHPDRFMGAAYLDPWEQPRAQIEHLLETPEFCAVKMECSVPTGLCGLHPEARLDDPELAWLWQAIDEHGKRLVLDLGTAGTRAYQTDAVRHMAESHPGLNIVIAHLGQLNPEVEAESGLLGAWEAQIDLGTLPNVWFDCAGIPAYLTDEAFPYPTMKTYLRRAFDRIGPGRIMWGTDVPGLLTSASYPQLVSMARSHTEFLRGPDQEAFLSGTALEVFASAKRAATNTQQSQSVVED